MDEKPMDVGDLMAWEQGDLDAAETLHLFSRLIRNGMAWRLQGCYGRMAASLIEGGFLAKDGTITERGREAIEWDGIA